MLLYITCAVVYNILLITNENKGVGSKQVHVLYTKNRDAKVVWSEHAPLTVQQKFYVQDSEYSFLSKLYQGTYNGGLFRYERQENKYTKKAVCCDMLYILI